MKENGGKRPFFTVARLAAALLCFAAFLVIGLAGYYLSAGEFVSAELAAVYCALDLVGAGAVLLRLGHFAVLYYIGCALGWAAGWFIAGLKGDFAPTAGAICTFFLIGVFSLFGAIAQWRAIRRKLARRREEKKAAADQLSEELAVARRERESAGAALAAAEVSAQEGISLGEGKVEENPTAPKEADGL